MYSGVKDGEKRSNYHRTQDSVLGSGVADGEAGVCFDPGHFYYLYNHLALFVDFFTLFWDGGDATPYVAI